MFSLKQSLLAFVVVTAGLVSGQVTQIDWGSNIFGDELVTSDGEEATLDEFVVELGSFANGFVPTAENTGDWVSNWRVFDAITDPDSDTDDFFVDGAGSAVRFAGNAELSESGLSLSEDASGSYVFGTDQQAYVFIRNSDEDTIGSEWLLYTSQTGVDWEFPSSGATHGFGLDFDLVEADQVVFGQANGIVGAGERDFIATTGLQTFTFVPEPGIIGYICLVGGLMIQRRKRTNSKGEFC